MLTGKVLTAAYLLNQTHPQTSSAMTECLNTMSPEEWQTLKAYIRTGTFINEEAAQ